MGREVGITSRVREEILRVREMKLSGGMGMGTIVRSRAGLYCRAPTEIELGLGLGWGLG